MTLFTLVLGVLIGFVVGSLVNALADYLPSARFAALTDDGIEPAPFQPHYPDGTIRPVLAWSAVLAALTGRWQGSSGSKLSRRHILTELLLAAAYALILGHFGWNTQTVFYLIVLAFMGLITIIDVEHKLVLFVVVLPAALIAVLDSALAPVPPPILKDSLVGGGVGFILFFVMFLGGIVFSRISGTNEIAFGFGDVMLGILSGLLLGWRPIFFALILTVILGAIGAVAFLASKALSRTGYSMFTALPYGPYIVVATLIVMFWREEIRLLLSGW